MKKRIFFAHETEECTIYLGTEISETLERFLDMVIQIGIRPEDISVSNNPGDNDDCKAKTIAYENMGNEQLVYLSLGNQTLIARRPPSDSIEIGEEVGICFSKEKMIFMQEENGEVICDVL